ncbi:MAG: WxcM-like domain-containing protein [Bacteroidetes bacterium]|nr:WxcM-like domain-containing protein [Bacteroidota bacterium]
MTKLKIIQLPKILDDRGNLTFIESEKHIPFKIKRAYWIYYAEFSKDKLKILK